MLASVVGEDGGDERIVCPFFSEEWEDRDSRLPIGVVSGLLLYVSPAGRHGNIDNQGISRITEKSAN